VTRRHETQHRRRLVLQVRIPDLPGSLALLLGLVGRSGANLVDVQHIREGLDLHIQETAVQLVLETRGPEHAAAVSAAIRGGGYDEATPIR
jgi:threonine dehydratase